MAFAHVTAGVRDVPRAITAVRAIEPRVLAALEFLMVGEPALPTEHARAIWTGEFPIEHSRVGRRNDGGAAAAAAVASVAASRSVHLLRAGPLLLMENVLPRFRDTGEPAIIHPFFGRRSHRGVRRLNTGRGSISSVKRRGMKTMFEIVAR